MHSSLFTMLSALAIALPVSTSLSPRVPNSQGATLRPIAIRDFEAATGLQRREASDDFSDLDTRTQAELIYGTPGDHGQLLLANMTLYAEDGLEIVMMERFEGLTSAVDCNGDDGTMSLTWSSQNSYEYALQQWKFINRSDNGTFLLIANHDGCGPDGERQPYFITKITEDDATITTYLTAKPAPWEDVTGTFDLDFGHITPYKHTAQPKARGLIGDLEGNFDETKSATFDVSAGTKGKVTPIYSDSKIALDCINCFTTGSFALTGHISTHHYKLTALTLSATPQDFQAELELEAKISAGASPASLQYEKELLSVPIPDAGISIPKIFTLGATLSYHVGVTSSFQGDATVDFGVSAGIPNTAQLTADLQNPDSSSATGFGGGSLTPLFDVKEMSASVTLGAYSKPKLSFGIEIIKIGKAEVDIGVKLPEVDITLTAAYDKDGVCTGNPTTTGIKLNSTLDIEVDLDITAHLGDSDTPSWSKPLFTYTHPIASQCFPLPIAGLSPSSTAVPTVTATTAQTQSPSVSQSHVYSASGVSAIPIVNGTSYIIAPSGYSIPASATALTGTPSMTGTGYVSGPSGTAASGTGSISGYSGIPPYPYSTSASGAASASGIGASSGRPPYPFPSGFSSKIVATGTGSAPISSGTAPASGLATSGVPSATVTAPSTPVTVPSASGTATGPSSSGTAALLRRSNFGLNSPPIRRAATGTEGCAMAKRFGKSVLVC